MILGVGFPCKVYHVYRGKGEQAREEDDNSSADRLRRRQSIVRSSWSLSSSEREGEKTRTEDDSSADRRPEREKRGESVRRVDKSSTDRPRGHESSVT